MIITEGGLFIIFDILFGVALCCVLPSFVQDNLRIAFPEPLSRAHGKCVILNSQRHEYWALGCYLDNIQDNLTSQRLSIDKICNQG